MTFTGTPPDPSFTPVMKQTWTKLTYIHWKYDPAVVQALLPPGLRVHTFDGHAWVGLVPFVLGLRFPLFSRWPWLTDFAETNVRTYVTDAQGNPGVWFFSLDADRLHSFLAARASYRLPYMWSPTTITESGVDIAYRVQRRWPGPKNASATIEIRRGEVIAPTDVTELEHFLTARWRLFNERRRGGLQYAPVLHQTWPLQRATLVSLEQDLIEAAGLPSPVGVPQVLWAPGVDVTVGLPHRVRDASAAFGS